MPREGHDIVVLAPAVTVCAISIHVPREGHDSALSSVRARQVISIHVPREGHDYVS